MPLKFKYTFHVFDGCVNFGIWFSVRNGKLSVSLKVNLGLAGEDCQHAVTDESLCPVTGCALGIDVCHWMFKTKVNMVQGQEDGPLKKFLTLDHPQHFFAQCISTLHM